MTKEEYCQAVYGMSLSTLREHSQENRALPAPYTRVTKLNSRRSGVNERRERYQRHQVENAQIRPAMNVAPPVIAPPSPPEEQRIPVMTEPPPAPRRDIPLSRLMDMVAEDDEDYEEEEDGEEEDFVNNYLMHLEDDLNELLRRQEGLDMALTRSRDLDDLLHQTMTTASYPQSQATQAPPANATVIESDECPICMEAFTGTNHIVGKCGHQFHASCLMQCLRSTDACPCCRQQVV